MSRKEKEVVVRLSEADLRAVGYIGEVLGREDLEETEEGEKEAGIALTSYPPNHHAWWFGGYEKKTEQGADEHKKRKQRNTAN